MKKRRPTALRLLGLALLLATSFSGSVDAAPRRPPNIVLILADDLGYGEVGFNGQRIHRTPNIDRLAAQGLRFTQHYAGSSVCAPSRCVLLTGRHAGRASVRDNIGVDAEGREIRPALPAGTVTVAHRLQSAGYTTACIGKWGLGDEGTTGTPGLQGFDHFFGYLHNTHGTKYYTEFIYRNAEKVALPGNYGSWRKQYGPDLLIADAERFLDENRARPFFLYFPFNLVHGQYVEPPPDPALPEPMLPDEMKLTAKERAYLAMVQRLDRDVGRLVDKIDELGLGRDTIVIFASDNGNRGLGEPNDARFHASGGLRGGKASLYEGGIRVPMVVRWSGTVRAGASDHVSGFCDFLVTACELAGVAPGTATDGISFAPLLRGQPQAGHESLYWELAKRDEPQVVPRQAVRFGRWKLVRNGDDPPELYDLETDRAEARDVAREQPGIVQQCTALMQAARVDHVLFPLKPGPGFE